MHLCKVKLSHPVKGCPGSCPVGCPAGCPHRSVAVLPRRLSRGMPRLNSVPRESNNDQTVSQVVNQIVSQGVNSTPS